MNASTPVDDNLSCAPLSVWFPGRKEVELRREARRAVAADEVRVRAIASALSHGTEMLVYRGEVPTELDLDLPTLEGSFHFPIKYGYASVGRVVEIGAAVNALREGDLVFVHHPHQTEYVVPATMPVRLPSGISPEQGVFLANVETAVNVMLDARVRLGERVVIFGQGVVGLILTQLVRLAGAATIVVVEPLALRREMALRVGADLALAPDSGVADEVRRLTDGIGADVVIEASGAPRALDVAIQCAAFQASIVVCSWYGTKGATLALGSAFHRHRLRLVSSQVSAIDPGLQPRWSKERRLAVARDLLARLRLCPLVTHRIPLRQAAEAYRLVDLCPAETVQVVLTYETRPV